MRHITLVLVGGFLVVETAPVHAWNEVGHAVIAKLAYDDLSKENPLLPLRVLEMLAKHPHFEEYLTHNQPAQANRAEWALIRASNWADWVRPPFSAGVKPDPRRVRYHRAFDHFINIPVRDGSVESAKAKSFVPDPDRPDIVSAFRQRMGELNEPLAAADDKAVALCWITHLIGDIHQPLHAATRVSRQFPEGDLGGNRFGVRVDGRPVRLHTYWDNVLGEVAGWQRDTAEHQVQVYALVVQVAESLRDPKYSRAELANDLSKRTAFVDWVKDSYEMAQKFAYRNGDQWLEATALTYSGSIPDNAPEVGAGYHERAQEVARRQAALAGYRLADKLKGIVVRGQGLGVRDQKSNVRDKKGQRLHLTPDP